jgi:two-component system OmpR family response regulator
MKRILVVDDSELILAMLQDALGEAGYATATAGTYAELDAQLASGDFDLILMDVNMPELYGDDVAMVLRSRGLRGLIYLFSGLSEDQLAQRAAEANLDGYLSKHHSAEEIVARIHRILA